MRARSPGPRSISKTVRAAKAHFFVATQSNNVYAFDETTGAQIWMKNAGGAGQGSCDNQARAS